jgi:fido (protein-threonine AMPylation protein)
LEGLFEKLSNEQHLRGLDQEAFARRASDILGTLNAVHPFREGNGRAQREFVRELAHNNRYWVDWSKVSREELYKASDLSFMRGQNEPFEELLKKANRADWLSADSGRQRFEAIRIYYALEPDTMHIIHILHGKRDVKRILENA